MSKTQAKETRYDKRENIPEECSCNFPYYLRIDNGISNTTLNKLLMEAKNSLFLFKNLKRLINGEK